MSGDLANEDRYIYKNADIVICNAIGCYKKAIQTTTLNVGKFGDIKLWFCDTCISRFKKDKRGN